MIGIRRTHLWNILEKEGKTLAALNAALFTSELDGRVAGKIVLARKTVADKIILNYCLAKGLVVAVNPIPVADLLVPRGHSRGTQPMSPVVQQRPGLRKVNHGGLKDPG